MIERLQTQLQKVFSLKPYNQRMDRYTAVMVYATTMLITVVYLFYSVTSFDWPVIDGTKGSDGPYTTMMDLALTDPLRRPSLVFYGLILLSIAAVLLVRRGQLEIAGWVPFIMWSISGVVLATLSTTAVGYAGQTLVLLVALGALLKRDRGIVVAMGVAFGMIALRAIDDPGWATDPTGPSLVNIVNHVLGAALLFALFLRYLGVSHDEGASEVMEEQSGNALIMRQIALQVARRAGPDAMLQEVVGVIRSRYTGLSQVQVYLLSEDGYEARLVASTSEMGQKMVSQHYGVLLGTTHIISQVMETGGAIIEGAGVRRSSERMPESQAQMVLPLRIGPKVLGAIDLQSQDARAFNEATTLANFQSLADSMALAVDNLVQHERAETRLKENETLVMEARAALHEVERLNEQLTGAAWSGYLQPRQDATNLSLDFIEESDNGHDDGSWSQALRDAMQINQLVQTQDDQRQIIAVPLRVRGRVIGAMEFELDSDRSFSPEDFDLVQEVSERFGMAMENVRLVDESQRQAQREALVNLITSRFQSASDVNTMLNEAANGLRDAFQAEKVTIRLGAPPDAVS